MNNTWFWKLFGFIRKIIIMLTASTVGCVGSVGCVGRVLFLSRALAKFDFLFIIIILLFFLILLLYHSNYL
jgi:hypothetical protein